MSARDELEEVIVDYAIDYHRQEYARTTRFSEVSTALAKFEAAIRRDQIEKDGQIAEQMYPLGSQVLGDAPSRIAAAIRAQSGDTNEQ